MKRIVPLVVAVAGVVLLAQVFLKWHTIHGIVMFSLGEHAQAISRFQMAVDENPDDLYAQFYLGQSYFEAGDFSHAIDHLRIATALVPSHHKAQYLLGSSLAEDNQIESATLAIKRAIDLSPGIPLYHYRLGLLYKEMAAYPEALNAFQLATDNGMEDADLYFNRAYVYLRMEQPAGARRLLRSALELNPDHFLARLEMARLFVAEKNYQQATGEYRLAVRSLPGNFLGHYELSEMMQVIGQLDAAYEELEMARQLDPENPQLHQRYFSLGIAFKEQNNLDNATRALSTAVRIAANIAEYHYQLGLLFRSMDMPQDAIAALKHAALLGMDSEDLHFSLGYLYRKSGSLTGALNEFTRVVALNPRHLHVHGELARIYKAQDRVDDAILEFQIDIDISPDKFFSHYDLGLLYKQESKFSEARESLEKAATLDPDYPHTCKILREIYQSLAMTKTDYSQQMETHCVLETEAP